MRRLFPARPQTVILSVLNPLLSAPAANSRRYCDQAGELLQIERNVDVEEFIALRDLHLHNSRSAKWRRCQAAGAKGGAALAVFEQEESAQFDIIRGLIVSSLQTTTSSKRTLVRLGDSTTKIKI